jgi:hypothetical protein
MEATGIRAVGPQLEVPPNHERRKSARVALIAGWVGHLRLAAEVRQQPRPRPHVDGLAHEDPPTAFNRQKPQ